MRGKLEIRKRIDRIKKIKLGKGTEENEKN
jgi:hypothetical protein